MGLGCVALLAIHSRVKLTIGLEGKRHTQITAYTSSLIKLIAIMAVSLSLSLFLSYMRPLRIIKTRNQKVEYSPSFGRLAKYFVKLFSARDDDYNSQNNSFIDALI